MQVLLNYSFAVALVVSSLASPQPQLRNLLRSRPNGLRGFSKKSDNSDISLDTPELAAKYGYPVITYKVATEDGYILTAHRIPNGKNAPPAPPGGRPVVWLLHGLLLSSADWVYQSKDEPLAFRLADGGYDVWLGNNRGNYYSREHQYLSVKSNKYWAFSFHEVGKYDLPAFFDLSKNVTGKPDLFYIGHSQGATAFFICMALRPEYNSRIRLYSGLAPATHFDGVRSPLRYLFPFAQQLDRLSNLLGTTEVLPNRNLNDLLGKTICSQVSPVQELCSNILFLIAGYDSAQLNRTMLPVILGHTPAGTSVRTLTHFAQCARSRKFRQYDYGRRKNIAIYGQKEPPEYDVSKVTAPVALYYGENDWIAPPYNVLRTAEELPNVQRVYGVPFEKFNHLDFLWAKDVVPLLYYQMELFMTIF